MPASSDQKIVVQCSCGTKLKVPAAARGKKVRCPKCQNAFVADDPKPIAKPPPDDDDGANFLLEELARAEQSAAAISDSEGTRVVACPNCAKHMSANSVLCVACGYNRETGRIAKVASARPTGAASAITKLAKGAGSFVLGTVLSVAGALIGAGIWLAVAVVTNLQIGWIAWGLGALAGLGMSLGYRTANARAGLTASLIAIAGIGVAKLAVFSFVLATLMGGISKDISVLRDEVKKGLTNQALDERGIFGEADRKARWDAEAQKAEVRVSNMANSEIERAAAQLKQYTQMREVLFDPTGAKAAKLALHRAKIRSNREGLAPDHYRRDIHFRQELEGAKQLPDADLKIAYEDLAQWEKEGKFVDQDYVRDALIYHFTDEARAKKAAAGIIIPNTEHHWTNLYREAKVEADALTPEQRRERFTQFDRAKFEVGLQDRLARHRAALRAMEQGLSPRDPERFRLKDAVAAECKTIQGEKLDAEIAALDAWEAGGKNSDPVYVRNRLIYAMMDDATSAQSPTESDQDEEEETHVEAPSPDWKKHHAEAVAKVDALPPDQHLQKWKELDGMQFDRRREQANTRLAENIKKGATEMGNTFFATMFHPMDAIFLLLAVATAWRIASGGGETA